MCVDAFSDGTDVTQKMSTFQQAMFTLESAGLVPILPLLWHARRALAATTLLTAWNSGATGVALWCLAWFGDACLSSSFDGLIDQVWYAAAVVLLAAAIAVLGAGRPG